jgi:hypothetical protein
MLLEIGNNLFMNLYVNKNYYKLNISFIHGIELIKKLYNLKYYKALNYGNSSSYFFFKKRK